MNGILNLAEPGISPVLQMTNVKNREVNSLAQDYMSGF